MRFDSSKNRQHQLYTQINSTIILVRSSKKVECMPLDKKYAVNWSTTTSIGQCAEMQAEKYLRKFGLKFLCRNFSRKIGEIDLIMLDNEMLVFIEIRYRKSIAFGHAAATVDYQKQKKLIRVAQLYLATKPNFKNIACRFDVVSIAGSLENPKITWIRSAFAVE